jgi:hypothetical protein
MEPGGDEMPMSTNMKTSSVSARARPVAEEPPPLPGQPVPCTTAERLLHIEAMGKRVHGYVQFMCQVGALTGTSAEAKKRAVLAFYERLTVLERQLARIQEELRLG